MKKLLLIFLTLFSASEINAQLPDSIVALNKINVIASDVILEIPLDNQFIQEKYGNFKKRWFYISTDTVPQSLRDATPAKGKLKEKYNIIYLQSSAKLMQEVREAKFHFILDKIVGKYRTNDFYFEQDLHTQWNKEIVSKLQEEHAFSVLNIDSLARAYAPIKRQMIDSLIKNEQQFVAQLDSNRDTITNEFVIKYLQQTSSRYNPTVICILLSTKMNFILYREVDSVSATFLDISFLDYEKLVNSKYIEEVLSNLEECKIRNEHYRLMVRTFKKVQNNLRKT